MLPVLLDVATTPSTPETLPLNVIVVLPLPPVMTVLMPTSLLEVIAPLAVIVIPPLLPPVTPRVDPLELLEPLIRPLVMVMPPVAVSAAIPSPPDEEMLLDMFTNTLPPPAVTALMPKPDPEIVPVSVTEMLALLAAFVI